MTSSDVFATGMLIFNCVWSALYQVGFGIANAYVSSQTTNARDECGAVWYCVMVLAILNFLVFIDGISRLVQFLVTSKRVTSNGLVAICHVGVSIWACVAYYNSSLDCVNYYESNFSMLWNMLYANVIIFFVNIGILVCYIVALCLWLFWLSKNNKNAELVVTAPAMDQSPV